MPDAKGERAGSVYFWKLVTFVHVASRRGLGVFAVVIIIIITIIITSIFIIIMVIITVVHDGRRVVFALVVLPDSDAPV